MYVHIYSDIQAKLQIFISSFLYIYRLLMIAFAGVQFN